jgi:hypothetical protein
MERSCAGVTLMGDESQVAAEPIQLGNDELGLCFLHAASAATSSGLGDQRPAPGN